MAENEKKSRPIWQRILAWILGVLLVVVVVLALLFVGLVPSRSVDEVASLGENLAMMNAVNKLSGSLFNDNGKLAERSTVALTPGEVNALLATSIRAYQVQHSGPMDAVLAGKFENGRIYLAAGQPFLGKLAVNVSCAVVPTVTDGKLQLAFSDVCVGRLPLPGSLVSGLVGDALAELERTPEYQSAMLVILEVKVNAAGNLEMTFVPSRIAFLLTPLLQR